MFNVWLENFSFDFDDSPKYTTLNSILNFATLEMRSSHGEDLAKKIKFRLDKFQITPYEDEGETFTLLRNTDYKFKVSSCCDVKPLSSFAQCLIHVLLVSRVGAVVRALAFHQCVQGLISRTRFHMWFEFVGSLLCSERFVSGNSGFPLSSKTNS